MALTYRRKVDSIQNIAKRIPFDPVAFAVLYLDFVPDPWQADFLRSREYRILLNCSRQSGKSTTTAVLALWEALYIPKSFVVIDSPSLRQSQELMLKFQEFLGRLQLEDSLDSDNKLSAQFANGSRVMALPGTEKTIRSLSAVTLLIEDEASRVTDELYNSTRPMLAVSQGRLILMSTPFGKRGHFFHIYSEERHRWQYFEIPAELCPRISPEFLAEEKESNPWFEQEYHCSFMESEDQLFKFDEIKKATDDDLEPMKF